MENIYSKNKKIYSSASHVSFVSLILCFVLVFVNIFSVGLLNNTEADTSSIWLLNQTEILEDSNNNYKISTPGQLAYVFFTILNGKTNTETYNIELNCDLDMSAHDWSSANVNCNLTFNGNNHFIHNLKCKSTGLGLLGANGLISKSTSGYINFKNLYIYGDIVINEGKNVWPGKTQQLVLPGISNLSQTSLMTGLFVGEKTSGTLTFENCNAFGKITSNITSKSNEICIGGFVGSANDFEATRCSNNVIITGNSSGYSKNIGGFVGCTKNTCRFELCSNFGEISGSFAYVGGLVGYADGLNLNTAKSYNSANITTSYSSGIAGGLVGYVKSIKNSTISHVYNTQKIESAGIAGGIIGDSNVKLNFNNLYNSGDVIATKNIVSSSSIIDSYTDTTSKAFNFDGADAIKYKIQFTSRTGYRKISNAPRDISIIGNDSKVSEKNKVYAIKPTSYNNSYTSYYCLSTSFYVSANNSECGNYTKTTKYKSEYTDTVPNHTRWYNDGTLIANGYNHAPYTQNMPFEGSYLLNLYATYKPNDKSSSVTLTSTLKLALYAYMGWSITTSINYLSVKSMYLSGLRAYFSKDNSNLYYISPVIHAYFYNSQNKADYECDLAIQDLYWQVNVSKGISSYSGIQYYTEYNIKNSSFDGNVFGKKDSINNGLPVFKDMYWEFG